MPNYALPFPEPADEADRARVAGMIDAMARGLTRQLPAMFMVPPHPDFDMRGTVRMIADEMERWFAGSTPPAGAAQFLAEYRRLSSPEGG